MKKHKRKYSKIAVTLSLIIAAIVGIRLNTLKGDQYMRNRVVKLVGNGVSCSGEQVRTSSGKDYILTAAHCSVIATDGFMTAINEAGEPNQVRVIAEDDKSDLLLLEGLPSLEGLHIADHDSRFQHVRTFTHGRGLDTYETSGVLIQDKRAQIGAFEIISKADHKRCEASPKYKEVDGLFFKICILDVQEMVTSASIVPGSSGGPIVDDRGDLIGVASATDGYFGYLVRLKDIQDFLRYR